jgi:glutamyl/glutaminyl-tRNA synthetase
LVDLAKKEGIKNSEFFMILRIAITGSKVSPPLNESLELLGKKEVIERLENLL